jgi:hypothetical protein
MFGKKTNYNGIEIEVGLGGLDAQKGSIKKHYSGDELLQRIGPLIEQDIDAEAKTQETQA